MNKEQAIQKLDDGKSRKFLLNPETNTLYISSSYIYGPDDTHANLAYGQNLNPDKVKGGMLKVDDGEFIFRNSSTTVPTASESDIKDFKGEVEIF